MWYAAIFRFIRRRLVLGIIFFLSLTYCLLKLGNNGNSDPDEQFEFKRERPLQWRTLQEDHNNNTNDLSETCRNSIQGKVLIVDDRGYVCHRSDLYYNGCCNIEAETAKQYNCDTCNINDHCCAIYEYCVSCCLNPAKREILEEVLTKTSGKQAALFASVKDHFELCLVKCRTNSHSVQHENKYRNPKSKHCYGQTESHESQKEISNNVL